MKEARKALRRRGANSPSQVQQEMVRSDLVRMESEIDKLQEEVDSCKVAKEVSKEIFEREASKDENSKAYGQPIRKKIEEILKNHRVDKGAAFGGKLQGNACRRLMADARLIVEEIKEYMCLPETSTTIIVGTNAEILNRCDIYCQLLVAMDGCISGLHTKRFQVSDAIIETTEKYVKKVMELCRFLGFSITPKLHCLEAHAVYFLKKHRGFADLAEDAGERAHQIESKRDAKLAAQRGHGRREFFKAVNEAKESDPRVQRRVEQLYQSTKG